MIMQDDRTKEQKSTHCLIVMATDRFMSGWGEAKGGSSYAGWACKPEDLSKVEYWVERRGDMNRVRVVSNDYRPNSTHCSHCHIYVADEKHPSLS